MWGDIITWFFLEFFNTTKLKYDLTSVGQKELLFMKCFLKTF